MDLAKLRQTISDSFDMSELQTICFDLGIDYENLPVRSKADMVRELLRFAERSGVTQEVIELCAKRRPQTDWSPFLHFPVHASLQPQNATAPQLELGSMTRLQHALVNLFDTQELRVLCETLAIDYNRLPGQCPEDKARSIITHFQRKRGLRRLVEEMERAKGSLYRYY